MNETEIERLVVRLVGDATSYLEMLAKAQQQTQQTMNQIKQHTSAMEGFGSRMEQVGQAASQAMALIGIGAGLKEFLEKWEHVQTTMIHMKSVLEANGRDVIGLTKRYEEFGKTLSETTMLTKTQARELLTMAESFGFTADQAERAAKNAAILGRLGQRDPRSTFGLVAAFEEGDTRKAMAFARQFKELRGVRDEVELVEKYERMLKTATKLSEEEMELLGAKTKKAQQAMEGFGVEIGKVLDEGLAPLANGLLKATKEFNQLSESTKSTVTNAVAATAAIIALSSAARMLWIVLSSNPIGAVIAGTAALIVVLGKLWPAAKQAAEAQKALNDQLNETNRHMQKHLDANPTDYESVNRHIQRLMDEYNKSNKRMMDERGKGLLFAEPAVIKREQENMERLKEMIEYWSKIFDDLVDDEEKRRKKLEEEGSAGYLARMLGKQAKDLSKAIQEETAGLGLSEHEKALKELVKKGLNQREAIRLYRQIVASSFKEEHLNLQKAFEESGLGELEKKQVEWMRKGFNSQQVGALKRLAEDTRLRDDAYKTIQEQKTPEEKLKERVGELTKELAKGMLTWGQYSRAVLDARQKILGAAAPIGAAVDAASNAARVLMYESMEKIRPSLPDVNLPPLPKMDFPQGREIPRPNMMQPIIGLAAPQLAAIMGTNVGNMALTGQSVADLTAALNNLTRALGQGPVVGVANMEP